MAPGNLPGRELIIRAPAGEWVYCYLNLRARCEAATTIFRIRNKTDLSQRRKFYQEGDIFRQPDLAGTFARLQRGPNEFYEGQTARLIVDDIAYNGLMTPADGGYVAKSVTAARKISRVRGDLNAATSSGGAV